MHGVESISPKSQAPSPKPQDYNSKNWKLGLGIWNLGLCVGKFIPVLTYIFVCSCLLTSFVSAQAFSCKKLLEKEKEVGYPVTDTHFQLLESIFQQINKQIVFDAAPSEAKALAICIAINDVLENDFGISYGVTNILSRGLDNHKLDCNFYSILFYDILNKQHGYNVFPVVTPGHMFIRWYLKNGSSFNYETTDKTSGSNQEYIDLFNISEQAITNKIYMSDISDKQIWATNLVEMASIMPPDNLKQKEKLSKDALTLDKKCVIAHFLKADIYIDQTKYDSAITYYNNLYRLDSLNYQIAIRIGNLYALLDKHLQAVNYYSKAIAINSANPELYIYRSKEFLRVDNVDKAMEDFEIAGNLLSKDNLFALLFNYILLTVLEQEIMQKYLEIHDKK